jgi:hypothetical protein
VRRSGTRSLRPLSARWFFFLFFVRKVWTLIIDSIENASIYCRLDARVEAAFHWLRSPRMLCAEVGRHQAQDSDMFALVQRYETIPHTKGRWVAHRHYIDLQYIVMRQRTSCFSPARATCLQSRKALSSSFFRMMRTCQCFAPNIPLKYTRSWSKYARMSEAMPDQRKLATRRMIGHDTCWLSAACR